VSDVIGVIDKIIFINTFIVILKFINIVILIFNFNNIIKIIIYNIIIIFRF